MEFFREAERKDHEKIESIIIFIFQLMQVYIKYYFRLCM